MPDPTFDTSKWSTTPPTAAPAAAGAGFDPSKWSTTPPPTKSGLAGPTEMRAYHPIARGAEEIGRLGAFGVGEALGGPAGAGLAATAADAGIALANKAAFGQPTNITPKTLTEDLGENVAGSYVGGVAGEAGSRMMDSLMGKPALGAAAKDEAVKGATAQAEFDYARQKAETDAATKIKGLHEKVAQTKAPEAKQAAIQSSLGRTPEATQQAVAGTMEKTPEGVSLPGPGMVGRQQNFWNSVIDPIHKMSDAAGAQYDKFWAKHLNDPIDPSPLASAAAEEEAYAGVHGISYSAPIQKLLNRAKTLMPDQVTMTLGATGKGGGKFSLTNEQIAELQRRGELEGEGLAASSYTPPTVQILRGLRTDASGLVASSTNGRDKAAAQNIVDAVDKTLDGSHVLSPQEQKTLQGLNAKYRTYKTIFDRNMLRKIGGSAEPTDVAGEIFDDPKRSQLLLANADKDQVSMLRRTYADWVNRNGDKVIKPEHAPALARLFPGTPLANPKSWLYLDKSMTRFEDVVRSSPEVRQRFMNEYQDQLHTIQTQSATTIVKEAEKQLSKMGTVGQNIITQMRAASDPIEAANIATKSMTGMDTLMAIQSIQSGKMKGQSTMDFILRKWPLYAAFTVGSMAMGRSPSPYMSGMAGLGVILSGTGAMRSAYLKRLAENPEMATAFWHAITNPGTSNNFKSLARMAVEAGVSDATSQGAKYATGVSLQGKTPDAIDPTTGKVRMEIEKSPSEMKESKGPGPGVESLEKSRADALAPTPSAAARAADVMKDLSKDKPPDVSHDLNRGRLSLEEVNKILKTGSKTDAMAMLDHVPLSEAMDSLEVAGPDERKMLMPLVQQKMMQQFKGGNFNKTLAANLAKRFQAVQKGAVNVSEA